MNPPPPPVISSQATPPPPPVTPPPIPTPLSSQGDAAPSASHIAETSRDEPLRVETPSATNTPSWREDLATALMSASMHTHRPTNEDDERTPLPAKTVLGDYTIDAMLGRGGYGITYQARHTVRGSLVVIKEHMPIGMAVRDHGNLDISYPSPAAEARFQASMEEFIEEITVLQSLEYPGIVPIIDSFEANDTAYYVMPFIAGTTLHLPEKGTLNQTFKRQEASRLQRILISLLKTLEYLDQHNIVHRDIKPENILITKGGQPVLLDFGSARQLRAGRVFTNVFTPDFCAPEQDCSRSDEQMSSLLGPQTDIYSLGATFYYLVSHMMPPRAEMRTMYVSDPYKPLSKRPELQELYGSEFLEGIDHAMEIEPASRWQSAAAWLDSLEQEESVLSPRLIRRLKIAGTFALLAMVIVGGLLFYALRERRQVRLAYGSGLNFTEGMLYDFSTELIDLPGSTQLQRRLSAGLQKYLASLQGMPEGSDNRLDRAMAAAWFNVGCNYLSLGQMNEAKEALMHAGSLESNIVQKNPADQRFRYELSRTHLKLAELAVRTAQYREADQHADEAVSLLSQLHHERPDNPNYGCDLGEALCFNIQHSRREGDFKMRREILEQVLKLYRKQVKDFPRHLASYAGLATTLCYYGLYAKDMGDFEAADNYMGEASKIFTDLTDNYPYRLSFKRGLARVLYHIGNLFFYEALTEEDPKLKEKKNQRSSEIFDRFIRTAHELRGSDDNNNEYVYLECRALSTKADLLLQRNKTNEALICCRALIEQVDKLLASEPNNKDYVIVKANALCSQAVAHQRTQRQMILSKKELAEARRLIKECIKASEECPDDMRFAYAETLAVSASVAINYGDNNFAASLLKEADEQMEILVSKAEHVSPRQKRCLELIDRQKKELSEKNSAQQN